MEMTGKKREIMSKKIFKYKGGLMPKKNTRKWFFIGKWYLLVQFGKPVVHLSRMPVRYKKIKIKGE